MECPSIVIESAAFFWFPLDAGNPLVEAGRLDS